MSNIKSLVQDIHKGKDLNTNLTIYGKKALEIYKDYSALELTFASYMLMEEVREEKSKYAVKEEKVLTVINENLSKIANPEIKEEELAEILSAMTEIRGEITAKMDLFTTYTDQMICYEYVLNRLEFKFLPKKELLLKQKGFHSQTFMDELMQYVFGSKDQAVITENLRTVIGQLPVRMTKQKFYETVNNALTLYKGGEKSSLDSFLYMMKTSAMLYEVKEYKEEYKEFENLVNELEETDYTTIEQKEYDSLVEKLERGALQIHEVTDFYYSMQSVVNQIYVTALCKQYECKETPLFKQCMRAIDLIAKGKATEEELIPLEGKIEEFAMDSSYLEAVMFEIQTAYGKELKTLKLDELMKNLLVMQSLLSGSLFVDLEEVKSEEIVDESYIQEKMDELTKLFDHRFAKVTKPVKRAMMGQVLGKLPMVFQNTDEVRNHIQTALFGCGDVPEQTTVILLLQQLMREEI